MTGANSGLPSIGRLLGLDVGDRRIGMALSDPLRLTAQPLGVLERTSLDHDLGELAEICQKNEVVGIVAGLPADREGQPGTQAEKVITFAEKVSEVTGTAVEMWDERFTTVEADRVLREGGVHGRKRKGVRDIIAAQMILQGYMDAHGGGFLR